jgi:hypothetical protein
MGTVDAVCEAVRDFLTPSPPAQQATASQDQTGQSGTGDGTRNAGRGECTGTLKTDSGRRVMTDLEMSYSSAEGKISCRIDLNQRREVTEIIVKVTDGAGCCAGGVCGCD